MTDRTIDDVHKKFKGKGGGPDAESILVDSNFDKKQGYVTVWTNKKDAAHLIERCKECIIDFHETSPGDEKDGGGVMLKINRKAFRGIVYAFRKA